MGRASERRHRCRRAAADVAHRVDLARGVLAHAQHGEGGRNHTVQAAGPFRPRAAMASAKPLNSLMLSQLAAGCFFCSDRTAARSCGVRSGSRRRASTRRRRSGPGARDAVAVIDEPADDRVPLVVGVVLRDRVDHARGRCGRCRRVLAKPSALPLMWKNSVPSLTFQP